ncbi:uncharacterized protein LOC114365583 [Ostrinia furnacalis]|uniref:uncharacterized protein LOC114365583 n=1 Tax=Ostrinia furnacalis TaxID=93504 RepID=UPI0010391CFD|nr:uncharacterized protein LOC114365583 [Ostrinia furnacalis]
MMKYFVVVFTFLFLRCKTVANQCQIAQKCVTDLSQENCSAFEVLTQNSVVFGCCPSCQMSTNPGNPEPETGCTAPSNCLPNGLYAPVQCKGDMFTGRCFCSDEKGNRIFGQMWRTDASEMTCACSRHRAQLEVTVNRGVTLHCTANGDYEPLQCDDGVCWCAQPKTGQPTAGPVQETDMRNLPCYSSTVTGEQYLRRCESIVHSIATVHREQSEHGTVFLGNPVTFCDYDGSYGPFQITNSIAYCTGRGGEILGSWQVMSSEMSGMNCNCARDSAVYFPERGMAVTETCQANGNYMPNQNVGGVFYCVDRDGYPTTGMLEEWPSDRCQSYA